MKLLGRWTSVADLTIHERRQMLALMQRHYENVRPGIFEADLREKQWAIQVFDPQSSHLCGFSTQMLLDVMVEGRPVKALFSGDTIVDHRYWGDQSLTRVSGQFAASLIDRCSGQELYWFLICQGYKTYRFLPVFFREFYPRVDVPTPTRIHAVIDALATQKFPATYDRKTGVVHATNMQYYLRNGIAGVTSERLKDPNVRFFVDRNPGHAKGDELCCLAPLTNRNFTKAAQRLINAPR